MKRILLPLMLAACLLGSASCISFEKPAPDKRYHVLEVERPGQARAEALQGTLKVSEAKISPRYDKNVLIYRIGDLQYETDFYNEFFVSPRELITEETLRWLEDSGLFALVVGGDYRLGNSYDLTLAVNSLYGDYRNPDAPQAVLDMQALVIGIGKHARREVIFKRDYTERVPIADHAAEACVAGLNKALANILARLEADLAEAFGEIEMPK